MKILICILITGTLLACRHRQVSLFRRIAAVQSGISFNNEVVENDTINPLDMEFLYNGGGVAVGDFNRDGLPDLYFTASNKSNKLYLNKGDLHFRDITETANVKGQGQWSNGASVVDINNDGWPDIYVCATIKKDPSQRTNLLYVNQGCNKDGLPVFREMAAEYGLADTSFSVQAAFFDYDNDGDLDMYLVTTKMTQRDVVQFSSNNTDPNPKDKDKLYRNDWNDSLKHPVFTDVSQSAGIREPGYGLGVAIVDIDQDGWKDIYVTNDFLSNDCLYINNRDGTFTNRLSDYFKHTSQNAMGNDIADINNDGLPDILTVDMNPADNYRKKKNLGGGNYAIYQNMMYGNYMLQYVRNTLQLNMGPRSVGTNMIGPPVFGDIAFLAGVAETDWSWNPSIVDVDNDGYRDILVTNGYPRDVTDHDFAAFRAKAGANISKKDLIAQIPRIRIANYAFRNRGDLTFENATEKWGMNIPSFSSGAVCVDLDNDGDLDYVVNNINGEAFLFENTIRANGKSGSDAHYLDIVFKGGIHNPAGIGAGARIFYDQTQMQAYENSPYRGYLSTVEPKAHFGLGTNISVDSVLIDWPGHRRQVIRHVTVDQCLRVDIADAVPEDTTVSAVMNSLFLDFTSVSGLSYVHHEVDHIDFNVEKLLPHKLSQYGPSLAVADLDGNGLDDIFMGTSAGEYKQRYFLQMPGGNFIEKQLPSVVDKDARLPENLGTLLFDADGDGHTDIYCAGGSNEFPAGAKEYQDRFWLNEGNGNFRLDTNAIPGNRVSKGCIKAVDFDNDGDLDLFIGGRVLPGSYPLPVNSYIYRNDSRPGHPKFTDVTMSVAPGLSGIGMVCDAVWTDFDNDGWMDLIVVGEWMPIRLFRNEHGKLLDVTPRAGLSNSTGWWNSIAAGDFDNDGDIDYVVGNLGLNSFYRADTLHPLRIYAKDFDGNGSLDAIITGYLPGKNGAPGEFPLASRDEIIKQLPIVKKKFLTYHAFGTAGFSDLFSKKEIAGAWVGVADNLSSCYMENLGNGKFTLRPLPMMAQVAPLYGMVVDDFDGDGNLDIACNGNDYGTEVSTGRYDALNGIVLLGDGIGNFRPLTIARSGVFIPGDGKALVRLRGSGNRYLLAASQNGGPLKIFQSTRTLPLISLKEDDRSVLLFTKNGKRRKEEMYYGSSFLSQSSRLIWAGSEIEKIGVTNSKGQKRWIR